MPHTVLISLPGELHGVEPVFSSPYQGEGGGKETKGRNSTRGRTASCDSLTSALLQRPFSMTGKSLYVVKID